MSARTLVAVGAAVTFLSLGGCTFVSWDQSLDTSFGPAAERTTYRVGGLRQEDWSGESRVTVIERADTMYTAADVGQEGNAMQTDMPANGAAMDQPMMPNQPSGQPNSAQPMPNQPAVSTANETPSGMPR
jgi:hypothetical protein